MICISLSILVVVAGIFLLAKTKTDELGVGFKFASYATILSGLLMTGATLTMCLGDCSSNKCEKHGHEHHQSCKGNDGCSSKCSKDDKCCKGEAKSCSKGDECCKDGAKSCAKGDKYCKDRSKHVFIYLRYASHRRKI